MTSPLKAVRAHCKDCCAGDPREIPFCPATSCPLHPIREGFHGNEDLEADLTPVSPEERPATRAALAGASALQLIRRRCIDCSGASLEQVRNCHFVECTLHPFRMGTNPNRKGIGFGSRAEWLPYARNRPLT